MKPLNDPIHLPTYSSSDELERAIRDTRIAMAWSLWIGFLMLVMKVFAAVITHSAAILSDAAESVVHVLAVSFASYSLSFSRRPADSTHPYGHDRISFFSAGFEGALIVMAALYILYEAVDRWIRGLYIQELELGTGFTLAATMINGLLGWFLIHRGRTYHSIILIANGKHVLTDSWTSLGVVVGLMLVYWTNWLPFDPIVAILVALNILWSGGKLIRESFGGLMDESNPDVASRIESVLREETEKLDIQFHGVRHRNAGNTLHIDFHLLFHRDISIARAHEMATAVEDAVRRAFDVHTEVTSHLEPFEEHNEQHLKFS